VDQPPQQKAEDMTAPENFTSISNIPLIAERRPDMTFFIQHCVFSYFERYVLLFDQNAQLMSDFRVSCKEQA